MNSDSSRKISSPAELIEFERVLDHLVEDFESRLGTSDEQPIESYVPEEGVPFRREICIELMRVELESRTRRGERVDVDEYIQRFSWIEDHDAVRNILTEELNRCASRFKIVESSALEKGSAGAEFLAPASKAVPEEAWPTIGSLVLDFKLNEKLGEGAFGRVYLAKQGELSERPVVLKFTHGVTMEPQWLARLQHANIVPVYSIHEWQGFEVICMPFFGREMLSDLFADLHDPSRTARLLSFDGVAGRPTNHGETSDDLDTIARSNEGDDDVHSRNSKVDQISREDRAIQIFLPIAAGLAHAHGKGVLHGDLKPANVLMANDGTPMILDFSLSLVSSSENHGFQIAGGTLPYMSPEQLRAIEQRSRVTLASDVYSFGLMLYQMLRGELLFSSEAERSLEGIRRLRKQRESFDPARLRRDKTVSSDLWQIMQACLEPRIEDRYPSAKELLEDLERHANHQPLKHLKTKYLPERIRKWRKRHPRLGSVASLATACLTLAVVCIVAVVLAWQSSVRVATMEQVKRFSDQFESTRSRLSSEPLVVRDAALTYRDSMSLINTWRGSEGRWLPTRRLKGIDSATREEVVRQVGELLLLTISLLDAQPSQFEGFNAADQANELRRAAVDFYQSQQMEVPIVFLNERFKLRDATASLNESTSGKEADYFVAVAAYINGELDLARRRIEVATAQNPTDFAAWFVQGNIMYRLRNFSDAEACYTRCLTLQPESEYALLHRGLSRVEQQDWNAAQFDFEKLLKQGTMSDVAAYNVALCRYQQGDTIRALEALDLLIESHASHVRGLLLRARLRTASGDEDGGAADLRHAFQIESREATDLVALGVACLPDDPGSAAEFFKKALTVEPQQYAALLNLAHVQAMYLKENDKALSTLDQLVSRYPTDAHAVASRGVILARLNQQAEALEAAEEALTIDPSSDTHFQLACINSLLAAHDPQRMQVAIDHLRKAAFDPNYAMLAFTDPDLESLRQDPRGRETLAAIQILYREGR